MRPVIGIAFGLCAAVWVIAPVATAQDDCAQCDDSTAGFSEATDYLTALGLLGQGETVLVAWKERAASPSHPLIRGYHIQPSDRSELFDLYLDSTGRLLTEAEQAALGIAPKRWNIQPIVKQSEIPKRRYASYTQNPQPKGIMKAAPPEAQLDLGPLDQAAIDREDALREQSEAKGPRRIGVFRVFDEPVRVENRYISRGQWEPAPDGGMVWTLSIRSPEAVGMRLHFSSIVLPPGLQVIVYDAHNPAESYGPYTSPYGNDTDLWTATCFTDLLIVECYVPPDASRQGLRLIMDRIVHLYVPFGDLRWGKAAGTCNLDVACSPEWLSTSLGVGGIGSIGASGYLWCTGSLIVDTDPTTHIPYFLTANHCVGDQAKASSVEVYWLYQTEYCGGAPPDPANVPRTTGGAEYLAGSPRLDGTDFALLRLRNSPPPGVSFLGWTTLPVETGAELTCIHHPGGDFKRISFGTKINDNGLYHSVLWHDGTTEGGSSGSPLFTDQQLIVGQLYGGLASCFRPEEPDEFGRFDLTYPLIESFLETDARPENIDGVGLVDDADLNWVIQAALGAQIPYDADVDGNGVVDSVDIQRVAMLVITG